jgi:predicted GNAT family N-acyltransferase
MGTEAKSPEHWSAKTQIDFEALVREGGEVAVAGLTDRIAGAVALACHQVGEKLVGVAALKRPKDSYRKKVSARSGFELSKSAFPFELGWVYVRPEGRGGGLSKQLVAACLATAGSAGVFATTREDNDPMRCCLAKNGFKRVGQPYKGERGDHLLVVYAQTLPEAEPGGDTARPADSDGL